MFLISYVQFQGTPVDSVPMEVLYHYGNDPPSCSQLSANWKQFIDLIHGLLYKNFGEFRASCNIALYIQCLTLQVLCPLPTSISASVYSSLLTCSSVSWSCVPSNLPLVTMETHSPSQRTSLLASEREDVSVEISATSI